MESGLLEKFVSFNSDHFVLHPNWTSYAMNKKGFKERANFKKKKSKHFFLLVNLGIAVFSGLEGILHTVFEDVKTGG